MMEILNYNYYGNLNDTDDEANGLPVSTCKLDDDEECCQTCEEECGEEAWRIACCSRIGRTALALLLMLLVYLIALAFSTTRSAQLPETNEPRAGINKTRAKEVLDALCDAFASGEAAGDSCNRLCYNREWEITDFYEGHKVVVMIKDGGQTAVFKSSMPFIDNYAKPSEKMDGEQFREKVVDLINEELMLGWPKQYSRHLMETLWPTLLRTKGEEMTPADRWSLWALISQPEFILFRVLALSRVTPKVIGTCGHMYQMESLVAFRMKGYYMNLKGKILVHLMGTLKLLYEFLNQPLQWCDVRFDNLGLSADYPKRFMLMDGDMVYTKDKLNSLIKGRPCATDTDCAVGDCKARCTADLTCSERSNENLEVFCDKLVKRLFPTSWSKNNKYLLACHDMSKNVTMRLNELRLAMVWNLPDV